MACVFVFGIVVANEFFCLPIKEREMSVISIGGRSLRSALPSD